MAVRRVRTAIFLGKRYQNTYEARNGPEKGCTRQRHKKGKGQVDNERPRHHAQRARAAQNAKLLELLEMIEED